MFSLKFFAILVCIFITQARNLKSSNLKINHDVKRYYGAIIPTEENRPPFKKPFSLEELKNLPDQFSVSQKWKDCPTMHDIRAQGHCGSCWAVSSASMISDRICIAGGGNVYLSAENINDCTTDADGCDGGIPHQAVDYYTTQGVVTGGPYKSNQGCMPYSFAPVNPVVEYIYPKDELTPPCVKKCRPDYKLSFKQDLHFGNGSESVPADPAQIQKEIYENGPVVASFDVYSDFQDYAGGVYKRSKTAVYKDHHAVKVMGWGVEQNENGDETPYWLVANSWGPNWGLNGYFKMLRGSNECRFESHVIASRLNIKKL